MIQPQDKDYIETRKIMLGLAAMPDIFKVLAQYIDDIFGVKTINIIYDIDALYQRPRLNICFEYASDKRQFYRAEDPFLFDKDKQDLIAKQFRHIVENHQSDSEIVLSEALNIDLNPIHLEDIWVIFSAFEPVAKIEANESIPNSELLRLKASIDCADIWEISRANAGVTFFLFTDKQVKYYTHSPKRKEWADSYFNLLASYDVFGYFKREQFDIALDSKQNFDTHYQSNWYHYYK